MRGGSTLPEIPCSIEKALNIIGNKWSFLVLRELYDGTKRFNELRRAITGISPNALTSTLKHLEKNEIIVRSVIPTVPVTVKYTLTEKGQAFHSVLKEMKKWGAEWG
ncbi:helix-turn-helix transcriptional regulator [Bacillaceae bacterium Marseille-Q3522]|nr:helix-turn-helix transcriptional regulator [Bacillaceae bacterium Marseille-Q3522]